MKVCKPKTVKQQIIRGIIGFGLLVAAGFAFKEHQYGLFFLFVALSLIPLRGCPSCWIVETCEVARKSNNTMQDRENIDTHPDVTTDSKP
jgi:hypothetical protein